MSPKAAPTVKQLQTLLTRIGSASSGTKNILQARFTKDVRKTLLPTYSGQERPASQSVRILSIDMGIKNLAYCVADIDRISKGRMSATMKITAWRKLDVVEETAAAEDEADASEEELNVYSPAAMAETAYSLLIGSLLQYTPDIILIERQRWRSSGGSSIQQWTVRVNTLESMLWAILTALRGESQRCSRESKLGEMAARRYRIFGVDPKRVGTFWVGGEANGEVVKRKSKKKGGKEETDTEVVDGEDQSSRKVATRKLSRGKAEKKAKISLLRSWLASTVASTRPFVSKQREDDTEYAIPHISFEFSESAETTRKALCSPTPPSRKKKDNATDAVDGREIRKLDDITDCFLQAAAWVAWETNRLNLVEGWCPSK